MAEYAIAVDMSFIGPPEATAEDFETFIDDVVEQIEKLGQQISVASELAECSTNFSAIIEGRDRNDATFQFLTRLRTALHAAGCNTARWPFVVSHQDVKELSTV